MVSVLAAVETKAGFADLGLEAIEDLLAATMLAESLALMTGDPEAVMEAQTPLGGLLRARQQLLADKGVVPAGIDWALT